MCVLEHIRCDAVLCMFYLIRNNPNHVLEAALPRVHVAARLKNQTVSVHSRYIDVPRCRTVQFAGSFVPAYVQFWNSLDEPCAAGKGVAAFKSHINSALFFG